MLKRFANELMVFSIVACLFGCSTATERSDAVSQDRIYQSYSVSYSKENNRTSAMAQFRFGDFTGTTLELTGKSEVKHSNFSLSRINFAGTSYDGDGAGFRDNHTFTYTNGDGKTFTNSGTITPIALKNTPSSFSRTSDLTIEFEGVPLQDGEDVTVYLTADTGSETATTRLKGATSVTVSKSRFAGMPAGSKKLYLRRSKTTKIQQGNTVGGSFNASFETERVSIELVD